jgi:uncharacterized protein (TIGR03083 family)
MAQIKPVSVVDVRPLFEPLHRELLMMLRTLAPEDWQRQTSAPQWNVADVVAHLIDSAVRRLSVDRDRHPMAVPEHPITDNDSLTTFLNELNGEWVRAHRRVSPRLLLDFLDVAGRQLVDWFENADLQSPAIFPVAWAGEQASAAWFDIAREYTERWHHHQQIAEAVMAPGLTSRKYLQPVIDISMRALPFAYRDVPAAPATAVTIEVAGDAGGAWTLVRDPEAWRLFAGSLSHVAVHVRIDQDTVWRMFFKQRTREQVLGAMSVGGRTDLAHPFAGVLAVMA